MGVYRRLPQWEYQRQSTRQGIIWVGKKHHVWKRAPDQTSCGEEPVFEPTQGQRENAREDPGPNKKRVPEDQSETPRYRLEVVARKEQMSDLDPCEQLVSGE